MTEHRLECVDVGSEFCPCYLAETNDCITCSHLQGKDFCECYWRGVCIYQEYANNGFKSKNNREELISRIEKKVKLNSNCSLLKLKVTKTLARQLKEPGAYVFLRDKKSTHYFDVPMSIMDTDETNGYIYIVYQVLGSKTKMLDKAKEELLVRGPYWNGLLGIKYLKVVRDSNCLVIAKGVAQAPAVLVIKKLLKSNNRVDLIIDKGNTGINFIYEHLKDVELDSLNIIEEEVYSDNAKILIKNKLQNDDIKLVFSGGSDVLHAHILSLVDDSAVSPYIVATNNNEFCCGEGICGACSTFLKDGKSVKTCKTQLSVREAIEGRITSD